MVFFLFMVFSSPCRVIELLLCNNAFIPTIVAHVIVACGCRLFRIGRYLG